jgi:general stress protein 26
MLKGKMEILNDIETKKEIWKENFSKWYTGGVDGGDFIIIKFTAESGRYYHKLQTDDFKIESIKMVYACPSHKRLREKSLLRL